MRALGMSPKFRTIQLGGKKPETSLYRAVQRYFDTCNRLDVNHDCNGQTDGRTDIIVANIAVNYVARPKTKVMLVFFSASVSR